MIGLLEEFFNWSSESGVVLNKRYKNIFERLKFEGKIEDND